MEIAKGAGSALEDIPNVAEKLGRLTRNSHMIGLLHTLLFGGRMKVRRPNRNSSGSLTGLFWHPYHMDMLVPCFALSRTCSESLAWVWVRVRAGA